MAYFHYLAVQVNTKSVCLVFLTYDRLVMFIKQSWSVIGGIPEKMLIDSYQNTVKFLNFWTQEILL